MLRNNLGQVVHTYVPLLSSSITWYRPKGGDALRLGRKPQRKVMAAYRRVDDLRSPAGWLPVHRDQLRAQRSVSSMGKPLPFLYFHTWCGLRANLECRSEMCCMQLAEIQDAKIRHLRNTSQFCLAISSPLRHVSTMGKRLYSNIISSTCPHNMVNFGPLTAEIGWRVWALQQISTGFTSWLGYCTDVAQRSSTKLCTMFGHLLGWYTLYTLSAAFAS